MGWVQGSGFRVQAAGFRVQGSGFRVQGWVLRAIPSRKDEDAVGERRELRVRLLSLCFLRWYLLGRCLAW